MKINNGEDSVHALRALCITENNAKRIIIVVYDYNHLDKEIPLILIKGEKDTFSHWEYALDFIIDNVAGETVWESRKTYVQISCFVDNVKFSESSLYGQRLLSATYIHLLYQTIGKS